MIESQEYQDNILNGIIKGHAEEQQKAKAFFAERKNELMLGNQDPLSGLGVTYDKKGKAPMEEV